MKRLKFFGLMALLVLCFAVVPTFAGIVREAAKSPAVDKSVKSVVQSTAAVQLDLSTVRVNTVISTESALPTMRSGTTAKTMPTLRTVTNTVEQPKINIGQVSTNTRGKPVLRFNGIGFNHYARADG